MPGQSKQIKKMVDRMKVDRSPATPPRMPGNPVLRNEMTDKRFNEGRTLMMDPDAFMEMRHHMNKNMGGESGPELLARLLLALRKV